MVATSPKTKRLKHELSELDIRMTEIVETARSETEGRLTEESRYELKKLKASYEEKFKILDKHIEVERLQTHLDVRRGVLSRLYGSV